MYCNFWSLTHREMEMWTLVHTCKLSPLFLCPPLKLRRMFVSLPPDVVIESPNRERERSRKLKLIWTAATPENWTSHPTLIRRKLFQWSKESIALFSFVP